LSGAVLEDQVADAFEKHGYIVFKRKNHCDILAVKPDMALAYLVECKDYALSKKQQILAIRELNRNYTRGLELLIQNRLCPGKILKVLVAHGFSYQAKKVYQYTPTEFLGHISSL